MLMVFSEHLLGSSRNPLVVERYPFVNAVSHRLRDCLPVPVDLRDLVDIGILALPAAVSGHRLKKGTPFATFVNHRLRGAMLEWIREHGCVANDLRRIHARLGNSLSDEPPCLKARKVNDRSRAVD